MRDWCVVMKGIYVGDFMSSFPVLSPSAGGVGGFYKFSFAPDVMLVNSR